MPALRTAAPHAILDHLSALADTTRSRILLLLDRHELTVTELCGVMQLPQSTVSRHLKALADTGWIAARAEGTSNLYSMTRDGLDPAARRLWALVREQVGSSAAASQDQRRLADAGLAPGSRRQWTVFDPATLRNAPVTVEVGRRELVRGGNVSIPAFRVEMEYAGLHTTSWVTDTGEVVREESPMGLISVREPAERAKAMAVPGQMRADLLAAAAVVPVMKQRIDNPRDVRRLRLRLEGANLSGPDLQSAAQTIEGNIVELRDPQEIGAGTIDTDTARFLAPEPFIESDAPEIRAEAETAVRNVTGNRARAEALTRHVNAMLEKKPTISLPSAREVLRTKIGDCNEHTVLYVAMARAVGIPARIDVGLVLVRGAFYYHAWPEVYIEAGSQGYWLPVDPTFNQFPADATHLRLARGGLDKQVAILPLIGHLKITVLDLELAPGSTPILVGRESTATPVPGPGRPPSGAARWCLPCFMGGK